MLLFFGKGIDKRIFGNYHSTEVDLKSVMTARYKKGQKVTIVPAKSQRLSPRDAAIEPYIGQSGKIVDYHWICPGTDIFYIYTVRIGDSKSEVVVHEDEIEAHIE